MRLVALSIIIGSLGTAACSSSSGGPATSSTPVSFSKTVLPIFEQSCGAANTVCHGTGLDPVMAGRPFLGDLTGGTDPSKVLPGIVGVPATEDPHLKIVQAGDSANSYMVYKLNGTQGTLTSSCMDGHNPSGGMPCGQQMPYATTPLQQSQIDAIVAWIDQGAQSN
jgi:hypothetical protein